MNSLILLDEVFKNGKFSKKSFKGWSIVENS